jgi:hypothetical protein
MLMYVFDGCLESIPLEAVARLPLLPSSLAFRTKRYPNSVGYAKIKSSMICQKNRFAGSNGGYSAKAGR